MKHSAAIIAIGVLLIPGCGGTSAIGVFPGAQPGKQASAVLKVTPSRDDSHDVLYASSTNGSVFIYAFPNVHLKKRLSIPGSTGASGICTDNKGHVFVRSIPAETTGVSTIYEYAIGGSQPISELTDSGIAEGCSFDPQTGNLAVSNWFDASNPYSSTDGSLAVFTASQGTPKVYYSGIYAIGLCGFDNHQNLYVAVYDLSTKTTQLARLDSAHASFVPLQLDTEINDAGGGFEPVVQWDGAHMTVSSSAGNGAPLLIYRLIVRGQKAKVLEAITLETAKNRTFAQTFIAGSQVVGVMSKNGRNDIITWAFPAGGSPTQQKRSGSVVQDGYFEGVVISQP